MRLRRDLRVARSPRVELPGQTNDQQRDSRDAGEHQKACARACYACRREWCRVGGVEHERLDRPLDVLQRERAKLLER